MTKELKSRLRTLKSTHKITFAMKIVAATAFNRLKHHVPGLFDFLDSFIALSPHIHTSHQNKGRLLIVVGGDRGLCGGYNAAIRKKAAKYLKEFSDAEVAYIGTKIVLKEFRGVFTETVQHLAQWTVLLDKLQPIWAHYGSVDIVYTVFHALYDQQVTLSVILDKGIARDRGPIDERLSQSSNLNSNDYKSNPKNGSSVAGYAFAEDDGTVILDETAIDISPLIHTAIVMKAIIHAQLCEFSSRMLSMDNATQNAEKMIETLDLTINKMRQAMITKELSETVGCLVKT